MLRVLGTASLVASYLAASTAMASGYEKAITWGGRSAGVAGIASPYIQGPEALYFNPAGLASDKIGQAVDLNVTGLSSTFKGPIENTNEVRESDTKFLTPFGLLYGASLNERLGFGIGGYISGGSQAKFDNLTVGPASGKEVETDLTIGEIAFGLGYRVNEKLKIGLAYRISMIDGQFAFIQRAGGNVINAKVTDLEGMNFAGYKLGAQYALSENTMLGLSYRSQVDISVKGKLGGTLDTPGPDFVLDENDATAKTTFPQAVTLGVQQKFGTSWNGLAEYVWTQYSRVEHVTLDGAITRGGGTVVAADATDLEQQWRDQHQVKLAGEYVGMAAPIRFGYIWTSQVTHDDYARASFTPPGNAHTVTLGSGYAFSEKFRLDGGFDYTWVKGEGNGAAAGAAAGDIRAGDYETVAYALHLGLGYSF